MTALQDVNDTVVIVDDELQNVVWMADYLESEGMYVLFASNVNEGIVHIEEAKYKALIIDLNIPILEPFEDAVSALGAVYSRYPGLFFGPTGKRNWVLHRSSHNILCS